MYINEENEIKKICPGKSSLEFIFHPQFLEKIQSNHSFAPNFQEWRLPRVISPSISLVNQAYGCIYLYFSQLHVIPSQPLISIIGWKIKGYFFLFKGYSDSCSPTSDCACKVKVLVDDVISVFILSFLEF